MASGSQTKIFRCHGDVYGIAGECAAESELRKWIKGGSQSEDMPNLEEMDFSAMKVTKTEIFYLDQSCFEWLKMLPPFGIGSGGCLRYCSIARRRISKEGGTSRYRFRYLQRRKNIHIKSLTLVRTARIAAGEAQGLCA